MWDPKQPIRKRRKDLGSSTLKRHGRLTLDEAQRFQIATIARRYGLIAEDGVGIRVPEVVRLLLIVGITPGAPAAETLRIAVRTNVKALVANYGSHLSTVVGGKARLRDTRVVFPRSTTFTVDGPLADQLEQFVPEYRTKNNRNVLGAITRGMVDRALRDPRMERIVAVYADIVNPFHREMIGFTERIKQHIASMAERLAVKIKERTG